MLNPDASPTTEWRICVSGYGSFEFSGTEAEAEEMRAHKARWEQAVARKHPLSETCPLCRKKATDANQG